LINKELTEGEGRVIEECVGTLWQSRRRRVIYKKTSTLSKSTYSSLFTDHLERLETVFQYHPIMSYVDKAAVLQGCMTFKRIKARYKDQCTASSLL
jgi:hypothetical protein